MNLFRKTPDYYDTGYEVVGRLEDKNFARHNEKYPPCQFYFSKKLWRARFWLWWTKLTAEPMWLRSWTLELREVKKEEKNV